MAEKKPKSLKKKIIYSAVAVLCIVGLGNAFIENRKVENLAAEGGFESLQEFKSAQRENISTKSEYDAYLQKKDKAEKKAAAQGGFLSVNEYRKAQSVKMPTKALYDKYIEQQAELKLADEKRKAEEAEKSRLAAIAEEKLKADEAENARLAAIAEEKRKADEVENARLAAISEEKRKADEAENARLAAIKEVTESQSRLLNSKWYGLIKTSIPYDYDKLVGKTCSEIDNLLKSTKTESGDVLVQGSYFGVSDENKVTWGALILEPKYDCDVEFGFSCASMKVNSRFENTVISTDTGLATILTNSGGGKTFIDYKDLPLGYVNTTHYYGEKLKKQFNTEVVKSRDLVCVEPR